MCIPPADRRCRAAFRAFSPSWRSDNGLAELSMGMSGDFEMAIRFGATYVRVGTAIFGARAKA